MLMVDDLVALDDSHVETTFRITPGNIFLENNKFLEAGLIENIAQTCSIIVGSSYFSVDDGKEENDAEVIGFISSIKSVELFNTAKVNDLLVSTSELISRFDGENFSMCDMKGEISCNGVLLLNCRLNLLIKKVKHED